MTGLGETHVGWVVKAHKIIKQNNVECKRVKVRERERERERERDMDRKKEIWKKKAQHDYII